LNRLVSGDLWKEISRLAKSSQRRQAALAYVSTDDQIRFQEGDLLIVDASDASIAGGNTSARVLSRALRNGVELYSLANLHAKVLLLDSTAVIGSANLSQSSKNSLVEAAVVTDQPSLVASARGLITQLKLHATPVDSRFIDRIRDIPVVRRRPSAKGRTPSVKVKPNSTWLVGVRSLDEDAFPSESQQASAGLELAEQHKVRSSSAVNWLRYAGNSSFRRKAREGDLVIQIWAESGRKIPTAVYRPESILYRQDEQTCTRFYIEEMATRERHTLSWREFKNLAKRVGVPGAVTPGMARQLQPYQVDDLLQSWGKSKSR